ncbi:MAG: response regulator [Desulfomonilaceae bacterium]|nr:response regulator [Desulfomonilaceae bacterium]
MPAARILVVEDEAIVAMEIEERLTKLGYIVVGTFSRGEDAVEQVKAMDPDLVLMDIKLAGEMDGVQAASIIRQKYDIPVVYLTAHSDETTLTKALGSIPLGYVVKPFSEVELHATIEVSLKKHQADMQSRDMAQSFGRATGIIGGALILTDGQGTIRHLNSLAEVMTGWSNTEAVGKPVTEVLVLNRRDSEETTDERCVPRAEDEFVVPAADCVLISREGSETAIEIAVLPMGDSDGLPRRVIFSFQENTERASGSRDWVSATANLLINAELSRSEGDARQAVSFYERALAVLETHVERDSPRVRLVLEDLANAYRQAGRDEDAQMFSIRSARIRSNGDSRSSLFDNGPAGYGSARA